MVAETHDMTLPDDLVTAPEVARRLGRPYTTVKFHLERAGLLRWEYAAQRLCSFAEAKAYFDRWYSVRPIEAPSEQQEERP